MKLNIYGLIAALVCPFLAGCISMPQAQFASAKVGEAFPPRKTPDQVEIYRSQLPTKSYSEIGSVSACCWADTNLLVERLRAKAAESGGDAIIGLDVSAQGSAMASVIRYK